LRHEIHWSSPTRRSSSQIGESVVDHFLQAALIRPCGAPETPYRPPNLSHISFHRREIRSDQCTYEQPAKPGRTTPAIVRRRFRADVHLSPEGSLAEASTKSEMKRKTTSMKRTKSKIMITIMSMIACTRLSYSYSCSWSCSKSYSSSCSFSHLRAARRPAKIAGPRAPLLPRTRVHVSRILSHAMTPSSVIRYRPSRTTRMSSTTDGDGRDGRDGSKKRPRDVTPIPVRG